MCVNAKLSRNTVGGFTADDTWDVKHITDSPLGCNSLSWAPFGHHGSAAAGAGPDGAPTPIAKRLVTGSCDNMLRIWKQADDAAEWEVVSQ